MLAQRPCRDIPLLLLDDDDAFRESLADSLALDGHRVLAFPSPRQAPPLESLGPLALVLTDCEMPGCHGLAFADAVQARHAGLPVVVVTSHRTRAIEDGVKARRAVHLVNKPLPYDELHSLIHRLARPKP